MTSATAFGCDIMITCEPSTSVMVELARSAMDRTTSLPAARHLVLAETNTHRVMSATHETP
jgi:hypothetical protein